MRPVAATDNPSSPPGAGPERALVAEAAAGDEAAWEALVSCYARRVYAMAWSRLRDADAAEEITQSVFATLAVKLRDGRYEEQGRFEPWLFRITMNRVRDEARRRRRRPEAPLEFASGVPAPPSADGPTGGDGDRLADLRRALGRLDERDREIIELRHHGQLAFAQIADLLGEPMGTVLARHHRALKKIKTLMEDDDAQNPGGPR